MATLQDMEAELQRQRRELNLILSTIFSKVDNTILDEIKKAHAKAAEDAKTNSNSH